MIVYQQRVAEQTGPTSIYIYIYMEVFFLIERISGFQKIIFKKLFLSVCSVFSILVFSI